MRVFQTAWVCLAATLDGWALAKPAGPTALEMHSYPESSAFTRKHCWVFASLCFQFANL